jgi:GNAT superfamily N-acetyltransferase
MNIEQLEDTNNAEFALFHKGIWAHADKAHYGDPLPDFTKHALTFVAKDVTGMLGYITLHSELGVANIDSLIVHDSAQRQGVGTQLLKRAEEEATKLGCHKIWIQTGIDWSARKLYESEGYILRCTLPNYYAKRDFVILDKDL